MSHSPTLETPPASSSVRLRCENTNAAEKIAPSAVIWPWKSGVSPTDVRRSLRRRAGRNGIVGIVAAGIVWTFLSATMAMVVLATALFLSSLAVVWPAAFIFLESILRALGTKVGEAVTWLCLAPVFYLFFLPFGLLFRRGRRDAMQRLLEPNATTYWEAHVTCHDGVGGGKVSHGGVADDAMNERAWKRLY